MALFFTNLLKKSVVVIALSHLNTKLSPREFEMLKAHLCESINELINSPPPAWLSSVQFCYFLKNNGVTSSESSWNVFLSHAGWMSMSFSLSQNDEEMPSDVSSLWTAPLVMRRAENRVSVPPHRDRECPGSWDKLTPLSPASLRRAEQALA